ncbi:zinc-dependent metalloprotease [Mucilaginibacter kameinonensis]|uniref:zinc-dependent metalloprotease n=1 Tax=Mucilaginibacter kameinonensis TaxID=452286 RepID=UPI000EF7E232|nr:zinc-dependent metalloprotease [Mucilaginibacter kameinonensis]
MKNYIKKLLFLGLLALTAHSSFGQTGRGWPFNLFSKKDTVKKDTVAKVVPRQALKSYASVITKAFKTQNGLFTVHSSKDIIYFEIPDSLLKRDIMVINRLTKAPAGLGMYPGEELDENTIRFEKTQDSSIRIRYHLIINEVDSADAISRAVRDASVDPIAISFPIVCYGKDSKSYVIDASKFLKDRSMVNNIDQSTQIAKGVNTFSMKDYRVESIHVYPENVEISISKNMDSKLVPATTPQLTVESHTSFIVLPQVPMRRRLSDQRVGYFVDKHFSFNDQQQRSEIKNFIVRWRLEPKPEDVEKWKKGELVEPRKPIVIYVDPATPKQWRPYLVAGINDWQKAFEQAGFKNAIIGKEWPENDTTMHMDDARYSMINYFPSDVANAYGPNIHDPRSGEIIQTHIGWYHNVMSLLHDWYMVQASAVDPAARKPKFDEKLMGELVRFVSSHEVGHTLGLRHNFGSSSLTPVDSLRSNSYLTKYGHTASIMDYARFNYVAQPEDHIEQKNLFPRIGDYDRWAIEWGYKYSGANTEDEDKKIMNGWIMNKSGSGKRTWYGDGETRKWDPRSQTEDLGDNAMKASAYGIKNLQRIVPNLVNWTKGEGGVNNNLLTMYKAVQSQYFNYMGHVLKNVAGLYYNPKSEEEKGLVYVPVSRNRQIEALAFFNQYLFKTPDWLLDKSVMARIEAPADPDFISDTQIRVLNTLLDFGTLGRMQALVNKFGTKAVPVDDFVAVIHKGIWKEIETDKAIKVDKYRRNLQKAYLGNLIAMLTTKESESAENDAFSIVKADLYKLQAELKRAIPRSTDKLTTYHLQDLERRIESMLRLS